MPNGLKRGRLPLENRTFWKITRILCKQCWPEIVCFHERRPLRTQSRLAHKLSKVTLLFVPDYQINIHLHQEDILNLTISSCFKLDLHDRGSLRLKLALSRAFKATLRPRPDMASQPSTWVREILSLANRSETSKEFGMTNWEQTNDQWTESPEGLTDHTTLLQNLPLLGIDMEAPSLPMAS